MKFLGWRTHEHRAPRHRLHRRDLHSTERARPRRGHRRPALRLDQHADHRDRRRPAPRRPRLGAAARRRPQALTVRTLSAPAAPRGLRRSLLRLPLAAYRYGLGFLFGHRLVLVSHTGRRSGRLHEVVLEVVARSPTGAVTVASGYGPRADWYRNLLADPDTTIALARDCQRAVA